METCRGALWFNGVANPVGMAVGTGVQIFCLEIEGRMSAAFGPKQALHYSRFRRSSGRPVLEARSLSLGSDF